MIVLPFYREKISSIYFNNFGERVIAYNPSFGFLEHGELAISFIDLEDRHGHEAVRLLLAFEKVLAASDARASALPDLADRIRQYLYLYELVGTIATEFYLGPSCMLKCGDSKLFCNAYIFSAILAGLLRLGIVDWQMAESFISSRQILIEHDEIRKSLSGMLESNLAGRHCHLPLSTSDTNMELNLQRQSIGRVLKFVQSVQP